MKKLKNNMINASNFISNPVILKRSITGYPHSNTLNQKKEKKKNLNEEEKEPNLNCNKTNNSYWKKKLSASFSVTTTDTYTEYPIKNINNSINNHSQNKIKKKDIQLKITKLKAQKYLILII